MSTLSENRVIHLSGLNGIRAIAALAVVISHITLSLDSFNLDAFIFGSTYEGSPRGLDLAGFGVSIFFSLSGFLITYLLLLEKEKQEIDVKNFYIRRALRIHPLYYSYLAVCLIVIFYFQLSFSGSSLLYYIFFAANIPFIFNTTLPLLSHYWSLGVEEQFYIFYPWIIKKVNKPFIILTIATIFLILVKLIFRIIDIKYGFPLPYLVLHVVRFQCMLIGALGAFCFFNQVKFFFKISTALITQIISWLVIILISVNHFHIFSVIDQEIISIITVFIILGQITKINRIFNLDLKGFDFLGKISYGIYVIHPLIILLIPKSITSNNLPLALNYLIVYLSILSLTVLTAYLSYEYFEKGFLRLKSKYSVIKTSATKDSST